jgi:hypothetical protein
LIVRIWFWLVSKSWFWKLRARIGKIEFLFERSKYKCNSSLSRAQVNIGIISSIAWIGLSSLFWVILTLCTIQFTEDYIRNTTTFLQPLSEDDKNFNIEQLRLYAQLLTAIFSIYFATIGIILTSGYTRLRRDIIQLLTTEQVGSVYSHILVFAAIFCLCATTFQPFASEPGFFIYSIGSFFTVISSLALFPLGQRLFNFFDLNLLVSTVILPKIVRHIEGAANPHNSIHLANHHSQKARIALMQLSYIDDRMKREKDGFSSNLPDLTNAYSSLLLHYLQQKHKIDQQSYWFPRRRKHNQWFFIGDSATSMAMKTRSQLTPEEKIDHQWLESEIIERLASHIELALKNENLELTLDLISRFSSRITTYSKQFQFDIGIREIQNMKSMIEKSFASFSFVADSKKEALLIGIADAWAAMGSNLCLETLHRMITIEQELERFFKRDEWTMESLRKLPTILQIELSIIVAQINFEQEIEGLRLSKPNYLQQLTIQKLLRIYAEILPVICDYHEKTVPDFIGSLTKVKMTKAATQVVLASLHNHWKLPHWFDKLDQLIKRYEKYEHYREDQYAMPKINTSDMVKGLAKTRDDAIAMLGRADLVGHIFEYNHTDELPDHFGQIYFELAEACIKSLAKNDEKMLCKVLTMFMSLSLFASDAKFSDPALDVNPEFRLHLISSAINDLASVLGFSIIYSAYFENPNLSKYALDRFNAIIEQTEDKQMYLKKMIRFSDMSAFTWRASPRDMIRINWKIDFERRARQDGFIDQMGRKNHKNKVVREFLRSNSDASHLFLAIDVLPKVNPIDFEINYQITDLSRRLAIEPEEV